MGIVFAWERTDGSDAACARDAKTVARRCAQRWWRSFCRGRRHEHSLDWGKDGKGAWFLRLPEWGQEVLFEELFAFAPLFADAILGFSFVENSFLVDGGGGAKQTRKGSSFLVIGVLFTVMLMLLVAYYVLKVVSAVLFRCFDACLPERDVEHEPPAPAVAHPSSPKPPKRATAPRKKKMPKKAETKSDASMEGIAMTALALVRPEFDDDAVDLGGSPRARSRSGQVDDDGFCPDTPRSAERFGTANPLRSPRGTSSGGQDRDPGARKASL